ncbi:hypothetical protein T281_03560 [Rhodomicrobium udaipurense JA643]|nr:hypothetical protein T281_03560 [Rhodomicrobium udaipurense JA643]
MNVLTPFFAIAFCAPPSIVAAEAVPAHRPMAAITAIIVPFNVMAVPLLCPEMPNRGEKARGKPVSPQLNKEEYNPGKQRS